jgi:hypothetical protein
MLPLHQRDIINRMLFLLFFHKSFLFAGSILKLVAGDGIEPPSGAYETPELPLL